MQEFSPHQWNAITAAHTPCRPRSPTITPLPLFHCGKSPHADAVDETNEMTTLQGYTMVSESSNEPHQQTQRNSIPIPRQSSYRSVVEDHMVYGCLDFELDRVLDRRRIGGGVVQEFYEIL